MKSPYDQPVSAPCGVTEPVPRIPFSNTGTLSRSSGPMEVKTLAESVRRLASTTISSESYAPGCRKLKSLHSCYQPPPIPRDRELIAPDVRLSCKLAANGLLPWPLVFTGPVGTGKTCAALCMVDAFGGWYQTAAEFLTLVETARRGEAQWPSGRLRSLSEVWSDWEKCQLVVIDDLGTREESTGPQYENLKRAIDQRMNYNRALIVCSNLTLPQIARVYDDRFSSRLSAGSLIEFDGPDRRRQ